MAESEDIDSDLNSSSAAIGEAPDTTKNNVKSGKKSFLSGSGIKSHHAFQQVKTA